MTRRSPIDGLVEIEPLDMEKIREEQWLHQEEELWKHAAIQMLARSVDFDMAMQRADDLLAAYRDRFDPRRKTQ